MSAPIFVLLICIYLTITMQPCLVVWWNYIDVASYLSVIMILISGIVVFTFGNGWVGIIIIAISIPIIGISTAILINKLYFSSEEEK